MAQGVLATVRNTGHQERADQRGHCRGQGVGQILQNAGRDHDARVRYGSGERTRPWALEDAQHAATLQSELGVVHVARGQPGSC
jgi:hypothetical protein